MSRRSSSEGPEAFINDVLEESKSSTGTWSLATHNRLTAFISVSTADEIIFLIDAITKELISPDCGSSARFKLAQLCTTVRRACPAIAPRFTEFQEELAAVAARTADPLDSAISKLLGSLFEPVNPGRSVPRPGPSTSCRTMLVQAKRPFMSRTPQPP
jgi:hypothetical protein